MTPTTHTKPKGAVAGMIGGTVLMLVAVAVLAVGAGALWADSHRGRDGYVSTGRQQFDTAGRALTLPSFQIGDVTPDWLIRRVRLSATSVSPRHPVFVGIGRSREVNRYLADVSRSELRDFGWDGATYANQTGGRTPAPPAKQQFWAATANGRGTQTVSWKLKHGDWEIVVMNADGTAGVDAAVEMGVHTPPLLGLGLAVVALGLMIGVGGFALVYRGTRPGAPVATSVPAAA
jgi:hypothetical protein